MTETTATIVKRKPFGERFFQWFVQYEGHEYGPFSGKAGCRVAIRHLEAGTYAEWRESCKPKSK